MKRICFFVAAIAMVMFAGCSKMDYREGGVYDGAVPGESSSVAGDSIARQWESITAGEWNDLDHWGFWSDLMQGQHEGNYSQYNGVWGFNTDGVVMVVVTDSEDKATCNVPIELGTDDDGVIWQARTNNHGEAALWVNLFGGGVVEESLWVKVDTVRMEETPIVTHWGDELTINHYTYHMYEARFALQVAFIVDATGSMYDEMDFLQEDLSNIINSVQSWNASLEIQTAAMVYRDVEDEYLTRISDFTTTLSTTQSFINQQHAGGGGDYPEAVHTALEKSLTDMLWQDGCRARLAFLILDAPPHEDEQVKASVRQSIKEYASRGIRLIPVSASGIDRSTEFLLRYMAMATDGTYIFITDDSGIGNSHLEPTVGEYEVKLLRDLIAEIMIRYLDVEK